MLGAWRAAAILIGKSLPARSRYIRKARQQGRRIIVLCFGAILVAIWLLDMLSTMLPGNLLDASPRRRALDEDEGLWKDAFSDEQRKDGAIVLHTLGLLYTFVALAIACDECFVPALEVITETLQLQKDVAGATFMAAGGSAPEFFTSMIGAVVVESDIGIGTIVGSAVFNVLFVIGTCALVSPEPLKLTWFPLARDSCFYIVDLIVLTIVFLDGAVYWGEALLLFVLYLLYVLFMRYSSRVEKWVLGRTDEPIHQAHEPERELSLQGIVPEEKVDKEATAPSEGKRSNVHAGSRAGSEFEDGVVRTYTGGDPESSRPISMGSERIARSSDGAAFRHKSRRNTKDHDRRTVQHRRGTALHSVRQSSRDKNGELVAQTWCLGSHTAEEEPSTMMRSSSSSARRVHMQMRVADAPPPLTEDDVSESFADCEALRQLPGCTVTSPSLCTAGQLGWQSQPAQHLQVSLPAEIGGGTAVEAPDTSPTHLMVVKESGGGPGEQELTAGAGDAGEEAEAEDEENEPLHCWPPGADGTIKDWLWYVLTLPIVFMLVMTVPDVRREGYKRCFIATFIVSILWIAFFTYSMIWFATAIAETCNMPDEILGLTVLAMGTSVPDLLTSVIVAFQGHGDMAVSSSIGSNIFDVTVGLPVPWLLFAALRNGKAVEVKNEGLGIMVMLLVLMLAFTVLTIMANRWIMGKKLGFSMLVLYVLFEVTAVVLVTVVFDR